MDTTYRITIPGDTVRQYGLTVEWMHSIIAPVECPADVRSETNRDGLPMIVVEMTTEQDEIGDAAAAELIEAIAATGHKHYVSYIGTDPAYVEPSNEERTARARANARAWLARR